MASNPIGSLLANKKIDTFERLIVFLAFACKNAFLDINNPQKIVLEDIQAIKLSLERANHRSGKLVGTVNFVIDKYHYYSTSNLLESVYPFTSFTPQNFLSAQSYSNQTHHHYHFNTSTIPNNIITIEQFLLWALHQWNISCSLTYLDNMTKSYQISQNFQNNVRLRVHNYSHEYSESFDIDSSIYTINFTIPFDWLQYITNYNILDSLYQVAVSDTARVNNPTQIVDEEFNPLDPYKPFTMSPATYNMLMALSGNNIVTAMQRLTVDASSGNTVADWTPDFLQG